MLGIDRLPPFFIKTQFPTSFKEQKVLKYMMEVVLRQKDGKIFILILLLQILIYKSQFWIRILQIKMQQLFDFSTTWYFAFGATEKTSLCTQFCRENDFAYFNNPQVQQFSQPIQKSAIIEGSVDCFNLIQPLKPHISVIFFGDNITNEEQLRIRKEYMQIGRCIQVKNLVYEQFRKIMYPNLIFFYGPVEEQNKAASFTLAQTINYEHSVLPKNANSLIAHCKKSQNYVVNGLFTCADEIKILEKYFNIRIVHFKYNRIDLPNSDCFFDSQYKLLPFLKSKCYYIPVKGTIQPVKIMDQVGIGLCPPLIFVNQTQQSNYLQNYVDCTDGLVLDINQVEKILFRKKLPLPNSVEGRVKCLTEIFYKDLGRNQIILKGFPTQANEFIYIENVNRKFDKFIDLSNLDNYQYSEPHLSQIYFLENKKLFRPNTKNPLKDELSEKTNYWVVGGASGSGKTTIAKYIADQFGFKFIQFDKDLAAVKEKLANPEEGQEVPLKKILNYYKNMIQNDKNCTYIFDCLTYENNDLAAWVECVGVPNIINIEVDEKEQIMRTRKKAEGDLGAQISEDERNKAKQNIQKANNFIEKIKSVSECCRIENIDFNKPQILVQPVINSILRPTIFLVQKNHHFSYQNIAVKYDMGYINLSTNKLRDTAKIVKCCGKQNIILNYYEEEDERLISEDLYWIEKNLGQIRYVGIAVPEEKTITYEKYKPEKEIKEVKEKVQGEGEGEGEKAPEQPPEGQVKKGLDIYDFEWSKPSEVKNLSQWFLKLKKNVVERNNSVAACFDGFSEVIKGVSETNNNYYEIVQ